ncbi:MAG: DNA methyltransferase [Bacteroidetes bacterium]|nr:DNA methyltransferase [Bacteroidota bacterium]
MFEEIALFDETEISNGKKNKLNDSDKAFHDWYRFVLSFPPHLVKNYISKFGLGAKDILLDPFCGTGTTLVEAKKNLIPSIGIEANPFAAFASDVKTDWSVNPNLLLSQAGEIVIEYRVRLRKDKISDNPSMDNLNVKNLRRLNYEQERLIIRNSISPLPLHKTLVLLDILNDYRESEFHKYYLIAAANVLVYKISNLRFGPEVGVGKIKNDSAVISEWTEEINKIATDLMRYSDYSNTNSHIIADDSRNLVKIMNGTKVSAVITSPPYPNEKDYTRTTRLESVLLGFINNKDDLRKLKRSLIRSNTRGVYKGDTDDVYIQGNREIQRIADDIEKKRKLLGKTSGFEKLYHKVTKLYFGGMAKHLIDMQTILRPNSYLAYVVGDQASYLRVMIRTGKLIGDIAESLGYELVNIDVFRKRFSTVTQSYLNEEVVILKWK